MIVISKEATSVTHVVDHCRCHTICGHEVNEYEFREAKSMSNKAGRLTCRVCESSRTRNRPHSLRDQRLIWNAVL